MILICQDDSKTQPTPPKTLKLPETLTLEELSDSLQTPTCCVRNPYSPIYPHKPLPPHEKKASRQKTKKRALKPRILVREGRDLKSSPCAERLASGSLVEEPPVLQSLPNCFLRRLFRCLLSAEQSVSASSVGLRRLFIFST